MQVICTFFYLIQFEEKIDVEFCGKQFPEEDPIDYKEKRKQINFIVVGTITDPAKIITGGMLSPYICKWICISFWLIINVITLF